MYHVRNILYATDFSSYSNAAYFHAVALAEAHHAQLTILYVCPPAIPGEPPVDRHYWHNQLLQIRPLNPRIPLNHTLLDGDPAREIVRYAHEAAPDLIVMGTHGRTGIERELMGSVADQVLRTAPCSVLVVKLPGANRPT
jgi:nucleotide-binding universal stress UspA family protein